MQPLENQSSMSVNLYVAITFMSVVDLRWGDCFHLSYVCHEAVPGPSLRAESATFGPVACVFLSSYYSRARQLLECLELEQNAVWLDD